MFFFLCHFSKKMLDKLAFILYFLHGKIEVLLLKTYGRKTIYANYTEEELLKMKDSDLIKSLISIIRNSQSIHETNKIHTGYLIDYLNGKQDIYVDKKKITRPEIDNKTVENWAYAFIDFKKTWLLGKPIQYVPVNEEDSDEISKLNDFCRFENKNVKDMEIFQDILTCGRGFRYTAPNRVEDIDDEAPFETINIDPELCEVVYSSQLGHEQLLAYVETSKEYINEEGKPLPYLEYTVYLRNKLLVFNDKSGELKLVNQKDENGENSPYKLLPLNKHYITEYYINKSRISLIEIGKDLFNDLNYLESLDKDDMEQFVNAIMVFTNAEVDEDDISAIRKMGAVSISSTENKQAKVELLEQRLNAEGTQIYYTRLINALHQILGIPKAGDSGQVSYGDTGQARLTGQGYTSAGIRATGDEVMFTMCDRNFLKTAIAICKNSNSGINHLRISNISANFQRDKSDNMLVKSETLMNLMNAKVPRKFANSIVGLFGDANAVTEEQNRLFGVEGAETTIQTSNETSLSNKNDDVNIDNAT